MELPARLEQIIEEVGREHAPDLRTSIYEIDLVREGDGWALVGETSEPAAAEALQRIAATIEPDAKLSTRIDRLPRPENGATSHALVSSAVAPMLAAPNIAEPAISHTLAGHRLMVLRESGHWSQCRSEDGYIGWVHSGYLTRTDEVEARKWQMAVEGEPSLSLGATLHGPGGELIARLPWGARFVERADGTAVLADGRSGIVTGDRVTERERPTRFPANGDAIVATARRWMGAPYIWGGIIPAGVDCSGLVQSVYGLHGIDMPRDSDQQAKQGVEVEPGESFEDLLAGDLLYFAEAPGRVTHVTISLGGSRIIHSSLGNGGVAYNDMAGSSGYERELRRIFVCARRVIPLPES